VATYRAQFNATNQFLFINSQDTKQ
jgi:hypothetical protein